MPTSFNALSHCYSIGMLNARLISIVLNAFSLFPIFLSIFICIKFLSQMVESSLLLLALHFMWVASELQIDCIPVLRNRQSTIWQTRGKTEQRHARTIPVFISICFGVGESANFKFILSELRENKVIFDYIYKWFFIHFRALNGTVIGNYLVW